MLTGETLKAVRAIAGVSQAQLALDAGVSAAGIAEFETGKRDLRGKGGAVAGMHGSWRNLFEIGTGTPELFR